MKILTIIGSYRRNGNTAQIGKAVNQHLSEVAAVQNVPLEIETIYLGAPEVQACRGCRICFNLGEEHCPIHDAFLTIKEKMRAADGIVIASPVYVDDVNGLTKNWIDRLAHVCHRPEFAGKCASLIVTVGSAYSAHSLGTLNLALSTWGFHITSKDSFTMGALMKSEQAQVAFAQRTKKNSRQTIYRDSNQSLYAPELSVLADVSNLSARLAKRSIFRHIRSALLAGPGLVLNQEKLLYSH